MNYQETTQVPNSLFDEYIPKLKPSEIIVLLIIIRQTLGWYNPKTRKRKVRDWISYKQFKTKTGLSIKTISQAIQNLITHNIIKATDKYGNELSSSMMRKGKVCIYYQCLLVERNKRKKTYAKKEREHRQNLPITKLTLTKLTTQKEKKNTIKKITDSQRITEILKRKEYP